MGREFILFQLLLGNTDAHFKNFAIFHTREGLSLKRKLKESAKMHSIAHILKVPVKLFLSY